MPPELSCTDIPRLPRGNPDNLSPSQTYQLAHSVRCRLMLSAERPDRNLRFVLGHAFTLDKIMLRLVEIEDEDEKAPQQREPTPPPAAEAGRVSFRDAPSSKRQRDEKMGIAAEPRKRASPPPPAKAGTDSDTDEDDEDGEDLALTLTTSNIAKAPPVVPKQQPPPAEMALPNLVPSSDSDSDEEEEEEEEEEPRRRIPDSLLETIIEEPGDEGLAELYETVASCPCHGKDAPVVEQIWEIPQAVLEEEERKRQEKKRLSKAAEKMQPVKRLGAGKRMGVVKVAA